MYIFCKFLSTRDPVINKIIDYINFYEREKTNKAKDYINTIFHNLENIIAKKITDNWIKENKVKIEQLFSNIKKDGINEENITQKIRNAVNILQELKSHSLLIDKIKTHFNFEKLDAFKIYVSDKKDDLRKILKWLEPYITKYQDIIDQEKEYHKLKDSLANLSLIITYELSKKEIVEINSDNLARAFASLNQDLFKLFSIINDKNIKELYKIKNTILKENNNKNYIDNLEEKSMRLMFYLTTILYNIEQITKHLDIKNQQIKEETFNKKLINDTTPLIIFFERSKKLWEIFSKLDDFAIFAYQQMYP